MRILALLLIFTAALGAARMTSAVGADGPAAPVAVALADTLPDAHDEDPETPPLPDDVVDDEAVFPLPHVGVAARATNTAHAPAEADPRRILRPPEA